MKHAARLLIVGIAFISNISWSDSLTKTKWSLGGDASFLIRTDFNAKNHLDLIFQPSASVIPFDNWEFGIRPIVNYAIMRQVPLANRVEWGFSIYSRRYFEIANTIFYYLGANAGGRIFDLEMQTGKATLGVENGILIGLNNAISIDLGIPMIAHFSKTARFLHLEIPIGYLGVKAFF